MIAYIKGTFAYRNADYIVVDNGGVGYKIFVPMSNFTGAKAGDEVMVYTHHHVREDDISLFGFQSRDFMGIFEMLLTVSGVGPKVALSVVSGISPADFCIAVVTNDTKRLTKAPGVGAKMAQRIILELKDKIGKEQLPGGAELPAGAEAVRGITGGGGTGPASKQAEAASALMVLGYSSSDAYTAVSKIYDENAPLEELIKLALKQLAKR